ncbi:shikimate dehydrogenase family protein [Robiginitalea sp.]|uniref:shikimate dehydrogenase family protein n=1 Tax=Robiginitalea sp. TaxID=1902411 RepID=UPI003C71B0E3
MRRFGLIGRDISYSFSPGYFKSKFDALGLADCSYEIFDLPEIDKFPEILSEKHLSGLNVTIPYKTAICPFLDHLDADAAEIGAVNTIRFTKAGLEGYNTDLIGFMNSLRPLLLPTDKAALILGAGGAARAIAFGLTKLGIHYRFVSRSPGKEKLSYGELDGNVLKNFQILINCTPLGTYPQVHAAPPIPYKALTKYHLLYDLIYNPELTTFLQSGQKAGTRIKNGLEMLHLQAEASWEIWNRGEGFRL